MAVESSISNKMNPSAAAAAGLERISQSPGRAQTGGPAGVGADFKQALNQVIQPKPAAPSTALGAMASSTASGAASLKFSSHAVDRMRSRGISFAPETMVKIENAVQRAAAKGSKDTLVLADDSALIVSVKNNTVVTVMDRAAMKENVFTNIDSTVFV